MAIRIGILGYGNLGRGTECAVHRMHTAGQTGCKTILDIPPALLSPLSGEALRRQLL